MKEKIKKYLGIEEAKDYSKEFESIEEKIKELEELFGKTTQVECAYCHKKFATYPYSGGYYTSQGGLKFDTSECLTKYQEKK